MRRYLTHPLLALGGTLLWGAIELLALLRSSWREGEVSRPGASPAASRLQANKP